MCPYSEVARILASDWLADLTVGTAEQGIRLKPAETWWREQPLPCVSWHVHLQCPAQSRVESWEARFLSQIRCTQLRRVSTHSLKDPGRPLWNPQTSIPCLMSQQALVTESDMLWLQCNITECKMSWIVGNTWWHWLLIASTKMICYSMHFCWVSSYNPWKSLPF